MKVVAIIQARMGSTRLPGKIMQDLAGAPMLARCVQRTRQAKTIDQVVVATTTGAADDVAAAHCRDQGFDCFRGQEDDVLDRYYQAARAHDAGAIVRITADCPFIDPDVIDRVVRAFLDAQPDLHYASNLFPHRTFPRGLDTEVVQTATLNQIWQEDQDPIRREHVTPFILQHYDRFKTHLITNEVDYSHLRWTVDTPEDLAFARHIYDHFEADNFRWADVVTLLEANPDWAAINEHVDQKYSL